MLAYAFIAGGYFVTIMSFAMIYAVFVIGLNVFMGFAGQVSFGHNAFAALSGYTSAVLTATYYWEPIAAFAVGLGLALLVALVVGWPTLRLKGHYLAMATLAIGLIVYEIAIQWQSVTQGYMGFPASRRSASAATRSCPSAASSLRSWCSSRCRPLPPRVAGIALRARAGRHRRQRGCGSGPRH